MTRARSPSSTVSPTSVPKKLTWEPLSIGSENKCSEMWRRECEARTLLRWPLFERRSFLEMVEKKRGDLGVAILKADIHLLWTMGKTHDRS